jgi:hypothetical protein
MKGQLLGEKYSLLPRARTLHVLRILCRSISKFVGYDGRLHCVRFGTFRLLIVPLLGQRFLETPVIVLPRCMSERIPVLRRNGLCFASNVQQPGFV